MPAKKIDLDEIPPVLKAFIATQDTVSKITKALEKLLADAKAAAGDKTPRTKDQYVVVLSDPNGELPKGIELTGWVVTIKEGDDAGTILDRSISAVAEFNTTKKGRKNPIKTLGEGFMYVTRKLFKNRNLVVKTKEPVRVLITNNKLPDSKSD